MNLKPSRITRLLLACAIASLAAGCRNAPGKPKPGEGSEELRPEQVVDFATLYKQNCAACHGANGQHAASISLANPVYLAFAGESNIQKAIAGGETGTLMPGFSKAAGGMLTDQQITIIAHGMVATWGTPLPAGSPAPPPYTSSLTGNAAQGQKNFTTYCARCHGADGTGIPGHLGSIVDPSYLALVNDQYLRSTVVSGRDGGHMPDWRSHQTTENAQPHILTDQEITDTVAWLASHRVATPGQPYQKPQ